jgi:DNA-binding LytR/AlgR family response regulator
MKVLIVEDEELAAATLRNMLRRINPRIEVMASLETVAASVQWLQQHQADLIFMDIHLGDGESFGIFREVTVSSPVIFTTAYDQYTLQAFKHQGIDYLLKPFDEADVRAALDKLAAIRQSAAPLLPVPVAGKLRNRFMIRVGNLIKTVPMEEVAWFMASDKYLFMITKDQQRYIIEETVSSLEPQLNPEIFFRINRKFIVSIHAIREMHRLPRNRVSIVLHPAPQEQMDIIVSEERAEEFKQWLNL